MSDWKELELSDFVDFGNGKKKPDSEGDIPIYGGNGILGYSADSNYQNETIIIGRVGAYCGSVYYENKPIWVSDNALAAKAKSGNSPKFLYYFLKNANLNQHAGGSSHPLVTQTLLNSLEYEICVDETEQNSIAEVLSSLDDKIDLLHRQNQTLEQMAETLFRQWFVEEADEDWAECTIEDICIRVASGGTPSTKIDLYYDGSINWYSTKELQDSFLLASDKKITEEGLNKSSAKLFPKNTILIAIYAAPTVGRLGVLQNEASFNQAACGLIADENKTSYEFLFLYLKSQRDELNAMASGSAQQNLNVSKIKEFPAFLVDTETLIAFKATIRPIFKKIESNTIQIQTLSKLRDTLLPKLMNGEVRVTF